MEEVKKNIPFSFKEESKDKEDSGGNRFFKAILPILIVVIIIELVLGIKTLLTPIPAAGKISGFNSGQISLVSNKSSYKLGDLVRVSVRISTGGHSTVGTDLFLKYDPNYLQISQSNNFLRGQIYQDYPIIHIDNKAGTIQISGIDPPDQPGFIGAGVFGELIFVAQKNGSTTLSVDYQKDSTNKSNIIENKTAKNILENGDILKLNINSGSLFSNPNSSSSQSCSPRQLSICTDGSGNTGSEWCSSIQDPVSCQIGCFTTQFGNQTGCHVVTGNTTLPKK